MLKPDKVGNVPPMRFTTIAVLLLLHLIRLLYSFQLSSSRSKKSVLQYLFSVYFSCTLTYTVPITLSQIK